MSHEIWKSRRLRFPRLPASSIIVLVVVVLRPRLLSLPPDRGRPRPRGRSGQESSIERRSNEIPRQLTYILIKRYIHSMDPLFDHEKLVVYCVELGFVAWIAAFLDDASKSAGRHRRELIEQLDRASLSVLLNTAEGNGKRQGRHRAKFFDGARGSALECAACLDAAVAKGLVSADRVCPGKQMLARVVAMWSRLIDRFNA
jgi:four helix bundle protein